MNHRLDRNADFLCHLVQDREDSLYEKVLDHEIAEQLRRSVEMQTEPGFDPAFLFQEADKWRL